MLTEKFVLSKLFMHIHWGNKIIDFGIEIIELCGFNFFKLINA